MKYWIEVISGYWKFEEELRGQRGLDCPNSTRHRNQMDGIRVGDIVLVYITGYNAPRNKGSSVVGVSTVETPPLVSDARIRIKLKDVLELPTPVKFSTIAALKSKSPLLKKMLRVRFQVYLGGITRNDFERIIRVHLVNLQAIETLRRENRD